MIETTTFCNIDCMFCPRDRYILKDRTMPMELFKKIIDSIYELKIPIEGLNLNGFGEPLLDPFLIDRIKYAKKLTKKIGFYTNGILLTEEKLKELKENVHHIWLSVHGNNPEEYERLMKGADFEKIKKIAKRAKEIFKDELWIYNCPEGKIEEYLEVKVCKEANQPFMSWAHDENVMKNMNTTIYSHPFCEIAGKDDTIMIRVDGTFMSCCMDWRKENDILNNSFPMCSKCNVNNVYFDNLENGNVEKKIKIVRELNDKINNS